MKHPKEAMELEQAGEESQEDVIKNCAGVAYAGMYQIRAILILNLVIANLLFSRFRYGQSRQFPTLPLADEKQTCI